MLDNITITHSMTADIGIKTRAMTLGKETELVSEYIDYRKSKFRSTENNEMITFIEPKVGNAYPDILFVEYDPNSYKSWNQCRNNLDKKDLKILYYIYSTNGGDLEKIVSQTGFSWKDAGLSLEKLLDAKLITRMDGRWIIKDKKSLAAKNIQAIEAKIDNWNVVLQQSILNRNFASESYALMGTKKLPSKDILSKFERLGIGICMKQENSFKVMKKPKINDIPVSFHSILINEWIGRILNGGKFNAVQ